MSHHFCFVEYITDISHLFFIFYKKNLVIIINYFVLLYFLNIYLYTYKIPKEKIQGVFHNFENINLFNIILLILLFEL